jgi:N-formylglutamate amidohydrolase
MIENGMQIEETAGFSVFNTDAVSIPVLISVPHAGRDYPDEIFDNLRIPRESLMRLEDRYADLLSKAAVTAGIPTIIAHRARAWIDLNRDEADYDVEMIDQSPAVLRARPSAKQRGGLGLIPRRLSGAGEIWKNPIGQASLKTRIEEYHRPYHATIAGVLAEMRDRFGGAILLDLHSMPPLAAQYGSTPPQFVVGDRYGRSAANQYSEMLMARLRQEKRACALNHPYSGDYVLNRHGDVRQNTHAIQLEVDRALYLDAAHREPNKAVQEIAVLVADCAMMLGQVIGEATLLAAE